VPKTFEFAEAFQILRDSPWSAFKDGGPCAASFSKENCSSGTYIFEGSLFSKALGAATKICYPIVIKDLNSPSYESFVYIKFGTKRLGMIVSIKH
jgi:hypothetical protein